MYLHHGFTTDFDNGLTVSVQFNAPHRDEDGKLVTVEMACWKTGKGPGDGEKTHGILWLTRDVWPENWSDDCSYDDIVGYVPVDRVMDFMDRAVQLPTDYISLLAVQKHTANIKQETARLKQEIEDLKADTTYYHGKLLKVK